MATVLVVDDEPLLQSMLRRILEQEGFSVYTAGCGSQAISVARLHSGEIDLLISDIVMPGMDGPSLATELQSLYPGLPVLLVSGYCEARQLDNHFPFLQKPFSMADLLARVNDLIAKRQAAA